MGLSRISWVESKTKSGHWFVVVLLTVGFLHCLESWCCLHLFLEVCYCSCSCYVLGWCTFIGWLLGGFSLQYLPWVILSRGRFFGFFRPCHCPCRFACFLGLGSLHTLVECSWESQKKETSLRNHKETSGPQWDHCDLITINSRAYDKKVGTGCA